MTEPTPAPTATAPTPSAAPRTRRAWMYERLRRRHRDRLAAWMPWLVLSLVVHAAVLAWLGMIKFGEPVVEPPPNISIDTDIVETFRTEPVTHRTVISDETAAAAGGASGGTGFGKGLGASADPGPVMDVETMNLAGIGRDLRARKAAVSPVTGVARTSDLTQRVVSGGARDYKSTLDETALAIAQQAKNTRPGRAVVVAILFDESLSLLDDRDMVSKQLNKTFADLKFEISDEEEKRLKWAVVSYGPQAKLLLRPTQDIQKVREAIARMPRDEAGMENTVNAIQFCITELWREADRMIIMLVSDEQGKDTGIGVELPYGQTHPLRATIELCKQKRAQLYVFGRESMFEDAGFWLTVKGLKNQTGWVTRGLSTYRLEVPPRPYYLGVASSYVPSGFGCYTLSLIADKTGGRFFLLSDQKSIYKDEALMPYEPEWCLPDEYDARIKASRVRTALVEVVDEYMQEVGGCCPPWELCLDTWQRQQYHWLQELTPGMNRKLQWCDAAIARLAPLRKELEREKFARKRWEANYDLTLAMLYRLKAVVLDYRAQMESAARQKDFPVKPPHEKGVIYVVSPAAAGKGRFLDGVEGENARKRALQALETVTRTHAGTPWAERARTEMASVTPLAVTFHIVDLPYPPPNPPRPNL